MVERYTVCILVEIETTVRLTEEQITDLVSIEAYDLFDLTPTIDSEVVAVKVNGKVL